MRRLLPGLLLLIGCAPRGTWIKPNAPDEQSRLERYECERDARYTQGSKYGTSVGVDEELEADCLRAHGWVFVSERHRERPR